MLSFGSAHVAHVYCVRPTVQVFSPADTHSRPWKEERTADRCRVPGAARQKAMTRVRKANARIAKLNLAA